MRVAQCMTTLLPMAFVCLLAAAQFATLFSNGGAAIAPTVKS